MEKVFRSKIQGETDENYSLALRLYIAFNGTKPNEWKVYETKPRKLL